MCPVSRWVPSCYVMCLTAERCVDWEDEYHHAVQSVWLQRDVCCEQLILITLCNMFDCSEMCGVSRSVPSCCTVFLSVDRCSLWADEFDSGMYCVSRQRDVCCMQMSLIMLCNDLDCAERCVLWADESDHAMWCVWLCREMCAVNRAVQ